MQVTEKTFHDEKEHRDWFHGKTDQYLSKHPERVHPTNWMLTERFYSHDKGRHKAACTELEEKLNRSGSDAGAAAQMMLGEEPGKQKKDPETQHKQAVGRTTSMLGKLSRQISSLETTIPSLRRTISSAALAKVKEGLQKCRQVKDDTLESLEDLKIFSTDTTQEEEKLEGLANLQHKLQEHTLAITDVLNMHKQLPIKKDPATSEERPNLLVRRKNQHTTCSKHN